MRRWFYALPALVYPAIAAASDPTGLFMLLIGIPAVVLSILFTVIALAAPRAGLVLLGLLLVAHLPVLWWASDVGYMKGAGTWLFLSLVISVAGCFLAWSRIEKRGGAATALLFSYGTLQQAAVQSSIFGRQLKGHPDELVGFEQSLLAINDPAFVASSGKSHHAIVKFNGRDDSRVSGMVFEVTESELGVADRYEPAGYQRISTTLASGKQAWVYASA